MTTRIGMTVASIALALALPTLAAQEPPADPGRSKDKGVSEEKAGADTEKKASKRDAGDERRSPEERERQAAAGRAFGKNHEKTVRDWFASKENQANLPPGIAKREELPPGLQRHLERNGTLPQDLQSRMQPLPDGLASQLPAPPAGVKRGVVGDRVVLMEEGTGKVLDVIKGALPRAKKESKRSS